MVRDTTVMDERRQERAALVKSLAQRPELQDARVLRAMEEVPRHLFVPPSMAKRAYRDVALSIGQGQTISQPFMVAFMTQTLELVPTDRVLEVGTGSGYQAAVLSRCCGEVVTVEILPDLSAQAARRFQILDIPNVKTVVGDGSRGHRPLAPYNAILVTAGGEDVPLPLVDQLAPHGRLVAPVGPSDLQVLALWRKDGEGRVTRQDFFTCQFVPLSGEYGRIP